MKDLFKTFGISIIVGIVITILIAIIGPNTCEKITDTTTAENITVKQIHTLIVEHIEDENLGIKPGTPEYTEYLMSMLTDGVDEELLSEPYYNEILVYAANYVTEFPQVDSTSITAKLGLFEKIPKSMINKKISELKDGSSSDEYVEVGVV